MESVNLHQVPDSEQSAITPKQCRSAHDKEECPWLPALNALGISSPFEIPQFTDYKIPECKRAPNTYAGGIRIVDVIGTVSMAHLSATSGYRLARPRLIKA
ncbi:hypothetical protein FBU59_001189 [Linderina macrospora]|uniref:Uncharacterized protein n=1 Tax=Linderina macrospora TaxID=4868 RepID=A0ACC1JEM6_9FUNG|nr:hypothetical protein FBU59_001189 [Linderina macrospora]